MSARARNIVILAAVGAVWLLIDMASKAALSGSQPGDVIAGPFLGIFQLAIVHNAGAAWGMFSGSSPILAVISVAVCALAVIYLLWISPDASAGQAVGLALVVAGGIGNAIDRFTNGYVLDFIETVFIDFPVFNIADIGVTCGVIIFIIALIVRPSSGPERNRTTDEGEETA